MLEKLRQLLFARQYQYKLTFRSPPGRVVLKDLAKFCRAHTSVFHESQRATDVQIGRKEVWERIVHHMHMSPESLWDLYDGREE